MDYRRANRAFLYMVLATITFSVLLSIYILTTGRMLSIFMNNFLCEMVILIPALIVVLYSGDRFSEIIPIKGIRLSTLLLTMLYLATLFPLVTFVNYLSMFFVENVVSGLTDEVLQQPMWIILLAIGFIGPLVEEVVFRGIMFHSYKKSGRIVASIILSSVLFGMMHLNFNQFAYGTVMGIMFCLLVEATGSVFYSFIAHGLFNSIEVILIYITPETTDESELLGTEFMSGASAYIMLGIYFILAIIFTAVALCVLFKISEIHGRREYLRSIPMYPRQGYKLITIPLIIAIGISLSYMTYLAIPY